MQPTDYIAYRSIYTAFIFYLTTSRTFLWICYCNPLISIATDWLLHFVIFIQHLLSIWQLPEPSMFPFVQFIQCFIPIWQLPEHSCWFVIVIFCFLMQLTDTMIPFVQFIQHLFSIWKLLEPSCRFIIVIFCSLRQLVDYVALRSIYTAFIVDLATSRTFLLICDCHSVLSNATNYVAFRSVYK